MHSLAPPPLFVARATCLWITHKDSKIISALFARQKAESGYTINMKGSLGQRFRFLVMRPQTAV